jgi:hypothetical protein
MAKIHKTSVYALKDVPTLDDYVIGTDSPNSKKTKNFPIGSIVALAAGNDNDKIISIGDITIVGNVLTIPVDLQWRIAGVIYTKTTISEFTIPYTTAGFNRKDIIVANNLGGVLILEGTESNTISISENIPSNALLVTEVNVTEGIILPTIPIVGGDFVKKIYAGAVTNFIIGDDISFPLPANGKSLLVFTNPALNSIAGFNLTQMSGLASDELPYEGKPFIIFNSTNTPLVLRHYDDINAQIWFDFKDNVDITIPAREHITILYYEQGCLDLYKSWSEQASSPTDVLPIGYFGLSQSGTNNPTLTTHYTTLPAGTITFVRDTLGRYSFTVPDSWALSTYFSRVVISVFDASFQKNIYIQINGNGLGGMYASFDTFNLTGTQVELNSTIRFSLTILPL